MRRWAAVIALSVGVASCAPSNVFVSQNYGALRKVALLPIANETNDLDGPIYIRKLLQQKLSESGYDLVPMADVDAKLLEKGFTDGGQLKATTPEKLGEWTGSDTLFYPVLEDFSYLNVGFYWQRRVKVSGRLVDAKTGEKLWEAERSWATRDLVTDQKNAKQQFAVQMAAKAIEKMTHVPLQAESRIAVDQLLNTLPNRR